MTPIPSSQLLDALRWRYATKQFDPQRRIPDDLLKILIETLVLSPSSFGLQPWRFIVVTDPELRRRLRAASWDQPQVTDCSHHLVLAVRRNLGLDHADRFLARTAAVRGVAVSSLDGYRSMMVDSIEKARRAGTLDGWQAHQVYIALGTLMTAAALLGVDTCPMEGIQPADYDEILGLGPEGYATVCACALGYRAATDKYALAPKVRFPVDEVVEHR
jgi:nitroreductase